MRAATGKSAFLAGPFKALVDPATSRMSDVEITRLERLIAYLEGLGYDVHNAHRREAWGQSFLPPDECTRQDFDEIAASDLFVAFPGSPPSPGTHVEIGWASALGKRMVLLLEEGATYAFLVEGLPSVADVTLLRIPPGSDGVEHLAAVLEGERPRATS